jgi:hypothetical protein
MTTYTLFCNARNGAETPMPRLASDCLRNAVRVAATDDGSVLANFKTDSQRKWWFAQHHGQAKSTSQNQGHHTAMGSKHGPQPEPKPMPKPKPKPAPGPKPMPQTQPKSTPRPRNDGKAQPQPQPGSGSAQPNPPIPSGSGTPINEQPQPNNNQANENADKIKQLTQQNESAQEQIQELQQQLHQLQQQGGGGMPVPQPVAQPVAPPALQPAVPATLPPVPVSSQPSMSPEWRDFYLTASQDMQASGNRAGGQFTPDGYISPSGRFIPNPDFIRRMPQPQYPMLQPAENPIVYPGGTPQMVFDPRTGGYRAPGLIAPGTSTFDV